MCELTQVPHHPEGRLSGRMTFPVAISTAPDPLDQVGSACSRIRIHTTAACAAGVVTGTVGGRQLALKDMLAGAELCECN